MDQRYSKGKKQVNILCILNGERQHYITVKKLPANNGDDCCLDCSHLFRTKNKLESHIKLCENKDICKVETSSEDTKKLEFHQ